MTPRCAALEWGFDSAPGALAPIRVLLSRAIHAYSAPIRPTRGHIAISPTVRLIRDAFAVRERLSDPRVVPRFRCTFLPGMPPSMSPGRSEIVLSRLTIPTWPSPRSERLGSSGYPAIRFKQGSFSGLIGSPLLRPVRLLAPLDGSDRVLSQPRGLLHPGFQ